MEITPLAEKILEENKWLVIKKTNGTISTILVDAIDFGKNASFLAGPFLKKYGLIQLTFERNPKTVREIVDHAIESSFKSNTYMPYPLKVKLFEKYGSDGTKAYVKINKSYRGELLISQIDYDLLTDVQKSKYKEDGVCGIFAQTKKGIAEMHSLFNEEEMQLWRDEVVKSFKSFEEEIEEAYHNKEKPYMLYLCGNDDFSWGKNFHSEFDALGFLNELKGRDGFIIAQSKMTFTN